ncbi:MAG: ribosomal RNA small subunit methyltransferase A [Deltaproteobacteria bacterium]|nr:ribosomal RNA small subunit methyltransferase A [Deltaproteobacteria bacterium]
MKKNPELSPKKSLGQHFLTDPALINKIVALARSESSEVVLEIGPGKGALTLPLSRAVGRVIAVEKDARLVELLKEKLSREAISNVEIINQDILEFDMCRLASPSQNRYKVLGNLPYNISSPVLEKLIENQSILSRAVLMFQKEVAERLCASPGGKTYGALTVLVRYHAAASAMLKAPREVFYPKPKVDSMVLELDFERPYSRRADDEAVFKKVVKAAFSHRRKTLLNSLGLFYHSWDRGILEDAMKMCKIDPKRRAETLDMDEFLSLASALSLTKNNADDKF